MQIKGWFYKLRKPYLRFSVWFLIFGLPFSVPLVIWSVVAGWVSTWDLILTGVFYSIAMLGITVGYHRLAAHRSFQAHPALKMVLLIAGSFGMQGSVANWCSIHFKHHRYVDQPQDPHSPVVHGFWYAHCGWLYKNYVPDLRRFGKRLLKDPQVRHVSKYYIVYSNLGLFLPLVLGGWTALLWAGFFRLFLTSHITWLVSSWCHHGAQGDSYRLNSGHSLNRFWVALITFGEGWHQHHHHHLKNPFFGNKWYEIDLGKYLILFFHWIGWARLHPGHLSK